MSTAKCLPGMSCFQQTPYPKNSTCKDCECTVKLPSGCTPPITIDSNLIVYNGPNLPNSGVNTGDDLNTVLSKIDALL